MNIFNMFYHQAQQRFQRGVLKNPQPELPEEDGDTTNTAGGGQSTGSSGYSNTTDGYRPGWSYYPVPGLHIGNCREMFRPYWGNYGQSHSQGHHCGGGFGGYIPMPSCGPTTPSAPPPAATPQVASTPSSPPTPPVTSTPSSPPTVTPPVTSTPSYPPTPTPPNIPSPSYPPTPTPPVTPTPPPVPSTSYPVPSPPKVMGSLNISGDPTINVTSPGVLVNPIKFNEPVGTPLNLLSDPDNNFSTTVTLHQVNNAGNVGIQDVAFSVNNHQVQFANNGNLLVDGVVQGNINDASFINPIDLGNGSSIKTAMADDGGGHQVERFILDTPEYEVTAAQRQPTNTLPYYDINIAERTVSAADNATGMDLPGQGTTGIDDLLRKEPG